MKILSASIHLVLGLILILLAVVTLKENWKTPALIFICGGASSIAIGAGIFTRVRWVRWLIYLLFPGVTAITGYLLAGSIIWPEYVAIVVIAGYVAYIALEICTWLMLRRFDDGHTSRSS